MRNHPYCPSLLMKRNRRRVNHGQCRMLAVLATLSIAFERIPQACVSAFNISACEDYMLADDVNSDQVLNRAEYINLLLDLSPYPNCPNITNMSSFLGTSIFGSAFDRLACLCEDYSKGAFDPYCCSGIRTPGYYPDSYTTTVCKVLYNVMELQCDSADALPTPNPSVASSPSSPPTIAKTSSPTVLPTQPPTKSPTRSPTNQPVTKTPTKSPTIPPTRARTSAPSVVTPFPTKSPVSNATITPTSAPQEDIATRPSAPFPVTMAPTESSAPDSTASPAGSRGNGVVVVPPDDGNDNNRAVAIAVPVGMAFILATVLIFVFLQRRRPGRGAPSSSMSASAKNAVTNDTPSYAPLDDTDNISDDLEAGTVPALGSRGSKRKAAQFVVPNQQEANSSGRMEKLLDKLEAEVAAGGSGSSVGDQAVEAVTLGGGVQPSLSSSAEGAESNYFSESSSSSASQSAPSSKSSLESDGDSDSGVDGYGGTTGSDGDDEDDTVSTDQSHGIISNESSIGVFDDTASDSSCSIVVLDTSKSNRSISSKSSSQSVPASVLSASKTLGRKSNVNEEDKRVNDGNDTAVTVTSLSMLPHLQVARSSSIDKSESDSGWESGDSIDSHDEPGDDILSTSPSPERKNSPRRVSPRTSPGRELPSPAGEEVEGLPLVLDNADQEIPAPPSLPRTAPTNSDGRKDLKTDDAWKMLENLGNIFGR